MGILQTNNSVNEYWKHLEATDIDYKGLLLRVATKFQTVVRFIGKILSDAAVELFYLFIFVYIIVSLGQGRDLIVSLFEPDRIYQGARIFCTILAAISYSVSMWIIPAFIFHQRDRVNADRPGYKPIFERHLFFVHRILPLIPFWLLSFVLFNGDYVIYYFIFMSLAQLGLVLLYDEKVKQEHRKWYGLTVLVLLIAAVIWFAVLFEDTYYYAKVALAVVLYLIAFMMHFIFFAADERLLKEYNKATPAHVSAFNKYKLNSWIYVILLALHLIVVFALFARKNLFEIAPESALLYIFSLNVILIDLVVYFINVSSLRKFAAFIIILIVILAYRCNDSINLNLHHYTIDSIQDTAKWANMERLTIEDRYQLLRDKIINRKFSEPYPIILVSGEGGGSRAGIWFSENLINFDYYTRGRFRDHIFSISTVSGSSVGLSTLFAFWEQADRGDSIDAKWMKLPAKVYSNNFVGSGITGLLLTDFWKALAPFSCGIEDRNSTLQFEEAYHTQRACMEITRNAVLKRGIGIPEGQMMLRRNFMYFFYNRNDSGNLSFRTDMPLAFINTCRSDDGRRGIFSPVKLSADYFNDAIDIVGYLYEDSLCRCSGQQPRWHPPRNISLGQACNTSELFPFFSASTYIDSLGNFVDGGYHENTGLKTTLDVYHKLRDMLRDCPDSTYMIYLVYIKNGTSEKQLYKPQLSELPFMTPLKAFSNQPFQGSASYFEEQARTLSKIDKKVQYVEVALNHRLIVDEDTTTYKSADKIAIEKEILQDLRCGIEKRGKDSINFPIARWLSNSIIRRIKLNASLNGSPNDSLITLLNNVNTVNGIKAASLDQFMKRKR